MNEFIVHPHEDRPGLEYKRIDRVINIPSQKLKVFECYNDDLRIRVFKDDPAEEAIHIFDNHTFSKFPFKCINVFHLSDGAICSMHMRGNVICWMAGTGEVLHTFKVKDSKTLIKLSATRVAVTRKNGGIIVLEYKKGSGFSQLGEFKISAPTIEDIKGNGSILSLVRYDQTVEVWNCITQKKLHSFKVGEFANCVEFSDDYIALANKFDGTLIVHENGGSFTRLGSVKFHSREFNKILCISSHLIIVTFGCGIYFLSLPSLTITDCFELEKSPSVSICILPCGNIYAAGKHGYCATFQAPEQYREDMKKFADREYEEAVTSTAAAVASKNSSSDDEVIEVVSESREPVLNNFEKDDDDVVSGPRERVREESEEDAPVEELEIEEGLNKIVEELDFHRSILVKKEWEAEKIVGDLQKQKREMRKMQAISKTETQALKEEMRQIQDNAKAEIEALKEAMKKLVLDLEAQKEFQETSEATSAAQKELIHKLMQDLETQKSSQEAMKEVMIEKLTLDYQVQRSKLKKLQERPNMKSEPLNADKENTQ